MFSSRSSTVSGLSLKTLLHFELVFVYSVRMWPSFILLQVPVHFSQHRLLKRLYYTSPIVHYWLLHHKLIDHIYVGFFLALYSVCFFHVSICFNINTILFWLLQLCTAVWNQEMWCRQVCCFFSSWFSYPGYSVVVYTF